MTQNNDQDKEYQLQQVIELLQFVLNLDDLEIIKSTVEAVIERLQEISK